MTDDTDTDSLGCPRAIAVGLVVCVPFWLVLVIMWLGVFR